MRAQAAATRTPQVNTGEQKAVQTQNDSEAGQSDKTHSPGSKNSTQSKESQTKRMMWVVPNFGAVSADAQLPPLSTREKFKLAEEDSFDYSAFVWTGFCFSELGTEFRP